MLIAFEGIDQSGKHTQTGLLEDTLNNEGINTVVYSFPDYHTPAGKVIRSALKGEVKLSIFEMQLLHASTRYHWSTRIAKALSEGFTVICDRYTESAVVYGDALGLDVSWTRGVQSLLPQPNLNILLDIPVALAMERKPEQRDLYESNEQFLSTVRDCYHKHAQRFDGWVIVDGTQSKEEIAAEVWKIVQHKSNPTWTPR